MIDVGGFLAALGAELARVVVIGETIEEVVLDEATCLMFWTTSGDRFAVEWRAGGELAGQGSLDLGEAP